MGGLPWRAGASSLTTLASAPSLLQTKSDNMLPNTVFRCYNEKLLHLSALRVFKTRGRWGEQMVLRGSKSELKNIGGRGTSLFSVYTRHKNGGI